jgi:hypothetical protein
MVACVKPALRGGRSVVAFLILFWVALGAAGLAARPAYGQENLQILSNEVSLDFPEKLTFHLAAIGPSRIDKVILHYGTDGRSCTSGEALQTLEFDPATEIDLQWEWDLARSGALPPGANVWWQWELIPSDGESTFTDVRSVTVEDDRFPWRSLEEDGIEVRWHQGETAFGQGLLDLSVRSIGELETMFGISPPGDVTLVVYPTSEDVAEALIHTYEWTGGVAFPDYNKIVIGVAPGESDWASEVIPHELAHLVVGALAYNCKGVALPTWLDEGLAENAQGSMPEARRDRLISALEDDSLPRLRSLSRGFSAYSDEASLSYIQSAAVVEFLLSAYDPGKMADLIATMRDGQGVDRAMEAVYGFDTDGLDIAWRNSLGFSLDIPSEPETSDSLPTSVPTLALWTPIAQGRETPNPPPTSPSALPSSTPPPIPTAAASQTAPPSLGEPSEANPLYYLLGSAGVLLLGAAIIIFLLKRGSH